MIKEETINGVVFVEQRTYYVYANEEDRKNDKWCLSTSDEKNFEYQKRQQKDKVIEPGKIRVKIVCYLDKNDKRCYCVESDNHIVSMGGEMFSMFDLRKYYDIERMIHDDREKNQVVSSKGRRRKLPIYRADISESYVIV